MSEITPTLVYWITRLDSLVALFTAGIVVSGLVLLATAIVAVSSYVDDELDISRKAVSFAKLFAAILIAFAIARVITPTAKEMCAVIAIPKMANSEIVNQQLPDAVKKVLMQANLYLDEKINEAAKEGDKE